MSKNKNFKLSLPSINLNGLELQLGLGGIHSVDKPGIYKANDEYGLLDADVTSFYPNAILNYNIFPEHLDKEVASEVLFEITDDRQKYKKKKKESPLFAALEGGLKVTANSWFGLYAYQQFMLCDLLCTYQTTVNNQLFLLHLIESLQLSNYEVISANTDGILLYIKHSEFNNVKSIISDWENKTKFKMEFAEYDLYVRKDVNNYLARKTDGVVKIKGDFVPQGAYLYPYYKYDLPEADNGHYLPIKGILKGYNCPIIAIALQKYYLDGIDPEETLYNHTDIYDFCASAKINSKFKNYLYQIEKNLLTQQETILTKQEVQKTVRFFISKPTVTETTITGNIIKKVEHNAPITQERVIQQGLRMSNLYHEESRINPATGRMKKFKDILLEGVNIPTIKVKEQVLGDREISLSPVGAYITMFNNYYDVAHFSDYNLDIDWYLSECYKIINKIGTIN